MPDSFVPNPPPLIQDPQETIKPLIISNRSSSSTFDATKVLAAVGVILTVTVVIIAIMWLVIQNLEQRVGKLETDLTASTPVSNQSAASAAAQLATKVATKSASASAK